MKPNTMAEDLATRQEIESQMQGLTFQDILTDLASRFIINNSAQELGSMDRIFFQIEEAHWFYQDFVRPVRRDLPGPSLPQFGELLLAACAPFAVFTYDPINAYKDFLKYKTSVPVRGAILLNPNRNKVLLVKGWRSNSSWGFPRGKINQDEADRDCAVRECWEETGYDISPHFNPSLQPHSQNAPDAPPKLSNLRALDTRQDFLDITTGGQQIRLYIVYDVPEHTIFETRTRKEISDIQWFSLKKLPGWSKGSGGNTKGKFYGVATVMRMLRIKLSSGPHGGYQSESTADEAAVPTEDEAAMEDLEEETRALQRFFLTEPAGTGPERFVSPSEPPTATAFFDSNASSAGRSESIATDAEEHNRQQRRKQLLRSLDDMLDLESRQTSGSNSPSSTYSHRQQAPKRRSTVADAPLAAGAPATDVAAAAAAAAPSALDGPGLLATLFATADQATREQHQQRRHSGSANIMPASPAHSHRSHHSSSSQRAPYPYPAPSKLYSPQPQHQSPLAMFEPTQAHHPPPLLPTQADSQHVQFQQPSSLSYQPPQHHFFTPDLPPHMQQQQHVQTQQVFPSFSQQPQQVPPPPPAQSQSFSLGPAIQPIALRPIPLLTNFQSPSPVMPQAAQQGRLPPIDPQQQASLLNLLNGGGSGGSGGGQSAAPSFERLQSWTNPNYPTGSPATNSGPTRPLFAL